MRTLLPVILAFALAVIIGCEEKSTEKTDTGLTGPEVTKLLDDLFMEQLRLSPIYLTYLGFDERKDEWDDISEAGEKRRQDLLEKQLATIDALDISQLDPPSRLNVRLFREMLENEISDYPWRYHSYPINQMHGDHSELPSILINLHTVDSVADARAYIARLEGLEHYFDQLLVQLDIREQKGIMPPKFAYPKVIEDCRNIVSGAPFDAGEPSALLADFTGKVAALDIDETEKSALIAEAETALLNHVKPAYEKLIGYIADQETRADTRDGVWKLPDGDAFYAHALQRTTTTDLTAEEIHNIGLQEVERIRNEMQEIMAKVAFEGSLQDFFEFMRTDPQFIYPQTEEGEARYLREATAIIENMKTRLDELFTVFPKADLKVKAVEDYREASAGIAFYNAPSLDGSRPGIYYANLYRMSDMPWYKMEALAYHEGIPGHHMQLAIAQELEGVPLFRKVAGYTAYSEGWGLYSELLPKEIGLYQNPYSDFGRLTLELWRAARLVLDTGIHAKRWTRQQAIDWLLENTPNPEGEIIKGVERYIVIPSQATAYKIGMLKILELREKAREALGEDFDIRAYHDLVLQNGSIPLNFLEEQVDAWIAAGGN